MSVFPLSMVGLLLNISEEFFVTGASSGLAVGRRSDCDTGYSKSYEHFFRLKTLEKLLMVFHLQAKDRTLRILDPRADVTASETKSHDGIKDSKVGQVGK